MSITGTTLKRLSGKRRSAQGDFDTRDHRYLLTIGLSLVRAKRLSVAKIFSRFKTFADHEAQCPDGRTATAIVAGCLVYRRVTEEGDNTSGKSTGSGLFAYRIKAMESDVMKSVLLALLDDQRRPVPTGTLNSTLDIRKLVDAEDAGPRYY